MSAPIAHAALRARHLLWLLALASAGCAADYAQSSDGGVPRPPTLIVVNKSQFFLEQLYLHRAPADYLGTKNRLGHDLAVEQSTTFTPPVIYNGAWYVTVVREKAEGGALVAITTRDPIQMNGGTYTLWVFDESFRLFVDSSVPPPYDAGPPDAGPDDGLSDGLSDGPGDADLGDLVPADGSVADLPDGGSDGSADGAGDLAPAPDIG